MCDKHQQHQNSAVLRRCNDTYREEMMRRALAKEQAASQLVATPHQRVAVECLLHEASHFDKRTHGPAVHSERDHLWHGLRGVVVGGGHEDDYPCTVAKLSSMMLWEDSRRRYAYAYYEDELYARRINQLRTLQRLDAQAANGGDPNFLPPPESLQPKPQARPSTAPPTPQKTTVAANAADTTSEQDDDHHQQQEQQQQQKQELGNGMSSQLRAFDTMMASQEEHSAAVKCEPTSPASSYGCPSESMLSPSDKLSIAGSSTNGSFRGTCLSDIFFETSTCKSPSPRNDITVAAATSVSASAMMQHQPQQQ